MPGIIQTRFGNALVTRIAPALDPSHYTTYACSMPLSTHWRPASCDEYGCLAYLNGWATTVDISTDIGRRQYDFITHDRERMAAAERLSPTLVKFTFEPGQPCFARSQHRVPLGRPSVFTRAHGDFRGYLGSPYVHKRAEEWCEDFASHQDRLATARKKG